MYAFEVIENISTFSITIFEFAIFLILLCKVWISLKVSMGVEYQFTTVRFVCFSFDLVFRNPLIMSYVTAVYFFTLQVLSLLLSFSLSDTPLHWIGMVMHFQESIFVHSEILSRGHPSQAPSFLHCLLADKI